MLIHKHQLSVLLTSCLTKRQAGCHAQFGQQPSKDLQGQLQVAYLTGRVPLEVTNALLGLLCLSETADMVTLCQAIKGRKCWLLKAL